jgi:hypothetical protein
MNLYYNLPPKQRYVQQLVTLFNSDEQLWESLKSKRAFVACFSRGYRRNSKSNLICLTLPRRAHRKTVWVGSRNDEIRSRSPKTTSIESVIHSVRGEKVILDVDLAHIYGATTKRLNEQVKSPCSMRFVSS